MMPSRSDVVSAARALRLELQAELHEADSPELSSRLHGVPESLSEATNREVQITITSILEAARWKASHPNDDGSEAPEIVSILTTNADNWIEDGVSRRASNSSHPDGQQLVISDDYWALLTKPLAVSSQDMTHSDYWKHLIQAGWKSRLKDGYVVFEHKKGGEVLHLLLDSDVGRAALKAVPAEGSTNSRAMSQ